MTIRLFQAIWGNSKHVQGTQIEMKPAVQKLFDACTSSRLQSSRGGMEKTGPASHACSSQQEGIIQQSWDDAGLC